MSNSVTATELARKLGDLLARVRYRHESFVVERNGKAVAKLVPADHLVPPALTSALAAWTGAALVDAGFADDLERVVAADTPPKNPWVS